MKKIKFLQIIIDIMYLIKSKEVGRDISPLPKNLNIDLTKSPLHLSSCQP